MNPIVKRIGKKRIHKLRMWDRLSAERVDYFIANSNTTKHRIEKYYNKPATVIHPMIDCSKYKVAEKTKGYFLAVGRLIPYKKFDLIVETFNRIGLPLKIVGNGISEQSLRRQAKGNIEFMGFVDDKKLKELYSEAEALIFPQVEDFGITAIESMASGRPVIAYKKGGALDSIKEEESGIFFEHQTPLHLKKAIEDYQQKKKTLNKTKIKEHAEKFDQKEFRKKLITYTKSKWENWQKEMA